MYIVGWLAVVVIQQLRADTTHHGFLTTLYGVAPNFIMGFCTPSLFLIHRAKARLWLPGVSDLVWFTTCIVISAAAIVAWEVCQPYFSALVFDTGDIVATLVGALLFFAGWPLVRKIIASM